MLTFYKETRVDVRPAAQDTIVDIAISPAGAQRWDSSSLYLGQEKHDSDTLQRTLPHDEKSFSHRYAAKQGSLYFRRKKTYPRTFAWRVVDSDRVLEIHSADISRSSHGLSEASLVLRFHFIAPIIPSGVVITDCEDADVLSVFVLIDAPQMYTLTLLPEFFINSSSIDQKIGDLARHYTPAPFTFAYPHRIFAVNPNEVFISLDNGTLLRMRRRAGDDGSNWSLVIFDEKPWGVSFRDLIRWNKQDSIKYNGRSLNLNTASAIAVSPDETFIFVVGLNHTLKVWNLAGQQLVASKDLLGKEIDAESSLARSLNPADNALIRIFNAEQTDDNAAFYVVTYSPHEGGQFKFWAVRGGVMTDLIVEDMFPDAILKPQDPDTSGSVFWDMADFQIKPTVDGRGMSLWILWKNNSLHRVYSLHFDLDNLEEAWQTNWMGVAAEVSSDRGTPAMEDWDVEDSSEKWTEFLFSPGRYSEEALATALLMYQDATNYKSSSSPKSLPGRALLKQQMMDVILQTVILRESSEGGGDEINYAKYRNDIDSRWRQIWQIIEDISKLQKEVLSLSYDTYVDTPWLSFADGCGVVRECSSTELLFHNAAEAIHKPNQSFGLIADHRNLSEELGPRPAYVSALLHLATAIAKELPSQLLDMADTALKIEIFDDPYLSASERIARFYELSQFDSLITDELASEIQASIAKTLAFDSQTTDVFMAAVATLPRKLSTPAGDLVSTAFGHSLTMRGIQERVVLMQEILMSLLLVTVFIEVEMSSESGPFDSKWVFTTLIDHLKDYEMARWLYLQRQTITIQPNAYASKTLPNKSEQRKHKLSIQNISLLEDLFLSSCRPRPVVDAPQTWTVMRQVDDVLALILRSGPVSMQAVSIQCDLIANGNLSTAMDFLRFQPTTAWATYVKGRLYLAQSDYATASLCFEKASFSMSHGKPQGDLVELSSSLIDPVAANYFYNGLIKYYQHILSLFEQAHAFAFVADFANMALRVLQSDVDSKEITDEYKSTRTDLLSRLFHASLQSARYNEAWSAVFRYTDTALQHSALTSLISTILTSSGPGKSGLEELLRLPVAFRPASVSRVDQILVSLAEKQKTGGQFMSGGYTPDYERVLEAYRIATHDVRGAAEVAYRRVQRLREAHNKASQESSMDEQDIERKELRRELLSLINLLSCMDESEAYVLVERPDLPPNSGLELWKHTRKDEDKAKVFNSPARPRPQPKPVPPVKRIVVTLADIRREYQAELDRLSRIESGDYAFGGDPMDEDVDMDVDIPTNGRQSRLDNYAPEASLMDLSA